MKVVIDIPEYRYADIQRIASVQLERWCPTLEQIIAKGVTINEPRTGKWIEASEDWRNQITWWQCSECGTPSSIKSNFCPNCGADMRGEEE